MFWDAEDLQELQGTTIFGEYCVLRIVRILLIRQVLDKIGKADAEKEYGEKLIPAVKVIFCVLV